MGYKPDKAFILAAGMGTRLRPYTDKIPKPMVSVGGTSIIKRTIEKLKYEGVQEILINLHHLAPVLQDHLKDIKDPSIIFSFEDTLLNTGGGIKKALSYFNSNPFYIINGDALWDDQTPTALSRLSSVWDNEKMDLAILLEPKDKMLSGFVGDYDCNNGAPTRSLQQTGAFMFAGISIAHPRIFEDTPNDAFSFLILMDKAQSQNRLCGVIHDDAWYHISTPRDLEEVDALFKARSP